MLKPEEFVHILRIYNMEDSMTKYQICKMLFGTYRSKSAYDKIEEYIKLGILVHDGGRRYIQEKKNIVKILKSSGFHIMMENIIEEKLLFAVTK